ncbi:MAG: glycosyltransferase family 2 protein [Candidatus Methylomirabilales bacterium]
MNKCLVSIGLPVYNSEQHIRQALDSLLVQDYQHFELIISDNASTDGTQQICLEYAARDGRIRYHRNERNMGIAWNLNRVFELSSGEYFKWAGSHDYVAPTFISACKRILDADPAVVLAYPLARVINEKGETVREIVPEIIDTRNLPTFGRVLVVVAKVEYCALELYGLFRVSALRRCRPLVTLIANDMVLMLEISILGSIALVPEVLLYRRDFLPILSEDKRIATALLRVNPEVRKRKSVRPSWELGIQQLVGGWRLAPLRKKFYLLPLIAYAHYARWHGQLKRELRRPYTLGEYKEPEY